MKISSKCYVVCSKVILFFILSFLLSTYYVLPVYAQTATLSLSPAAGTFNRSCNFTLDVILNTGGAQTDGTDAILLYDPARVAATSISNGTIYPDYPGNNIDDVGGKITVSGLASVSSAFSGTGTLASVNFTVKSDAQTAATQIKFDFDPTDKSKTTDSNVVERGAGTDILNSVTNGSYTIGTGTCSGGTGTGVGSRGSISTPSGQPDDGFSKSLPPAGTEQFTAMIAIIGGALTILGILGLALL